MPEFLILHTPQEALEKYVKSMTSILLTEIIPTANALGRVCSEKIIAPYPLPSFSRSTVDGYAVIASDTRGASESSPIYLKLSDEVEMGKPATMEVRAGECILIHTGGMLPSQADSVVMLENTQKIGDSEIEITRQSAPSENMIAVGEEVRTHEIIIDSGTRLRPMDLGGLLALGITRVQVYKKPIVGILSSGDEVIPPDQELTYGKVRDINSYTLSALVDQAGGEAVRYGIVPDQLEALNNLAKLAWSECDLVIITAGSSASMRDYTARVIQGLGKPGVLVHGLSIRPGKPTILGICDQKPVIGLPGNPVSAYVIATLFVLPVLERLMGINRGRIRPSVKANLSVNVSSQAGREDWIPAQLISTDEGYQAVPIFAKSNMVFSLVRADGLFKIPASANGLPSGTKVEVILLN